jgi:hypothetical protein
MIRNNMTYLIIKQISSMKNLTMIAREFDLGMSKEFLTTMYKDATAEKKNFLMIDLEADQRDRFRKGFNDIYEIEDEEAED